MDGYGRSGYVNVFAVSRGWVGQCVAAFHNVRHSPALLGGAVRAVTAETTNIGFAGRTQPHRGELVAGLIREIATFGHQYFAAFDLPAALP